MILKWFTGRNTKPGRTAEIRDYLLYGRDMLEEELAPERGTRALAEDLFNLGHEGGEPGSFDWAERMARTRFEFGNDHAVKGAEEDLCIYKHLILSPDPKDGASLEELREFMRRWVEECFPSFEVAVLYHDDSTERLERGEEGILHAHVIVNNTNLDPDAPGLGRITSYLSKSKSAHIKSFTQELAREFGWHSFPDDSPDAGSDPSIDDMLLVKDLRELGSEEGSKARDAIQWTQRATKQRSAYTKNETEALKRGEYSWKEDLRARIKIARYVAKSLPEFERALTLLGVGYETKDDKRGNRSYKFSHPDAAIHPRWVCNENRLGYLFSYASIVKGYDDPKAMSGDGFVMPKGTESFYRKQVMRTIRDTFNASYDQELVRSFADAKYRSMVETMQEKYGARGIISLGTMPRGGDLTLSDVAAYLETNSRHGIRTVADYAEAIAQTESSGERSALERAREVHKVMTNAVRMPFYYRPSAELSRFDDEAARALLEKRYGKTAIAAAAAAEEGGADRIRSSSKEHVGDKDKLDRGKRLAPKSVSARSKRRDEATIENEDR